MVHVLGAKVVKETPLLAMLGREGGEEGGGGVRTLQE